MTTVYLVTHSIMLLIILTIFGIIAEQFLLRILRAILSCMRSFIHYLKNDPEAGKKPLTNQKKVSYPPKAVKTIHSHG